MIAMTRHRVWQETGEIKSLAKAKRQKGFSIRTIMAKGKDQRGQGVRKQMKGGEIVYWWL